MGKILAFLLAGLMVAAAAGAEASVEATQERALALQGRPLDLVASGDGERLFVLLDGGQVQVFSPAGESLGFFQVDRKADRIAVDPRGERLFATSAEGKLLQTLSLEYVRTVRTDGSPFKGVADAPVVVAVFSDFQ